MVEITHKPDDPDEPVWLMVEEQNGQRREWWRVRLWTGEIREFSTRAEASEAYWS
jgi:hypothetical protein